MTHPDPATSVNAGTPKELIAKSRQLRQDGDLTAALALARKAVGLAPEKPSANVELAHTLSASEDTMAEAVIAWRKCIDMFPSARRPFWFRKLLKAKLVTWGQLRGREDVDALEHELNAMHQEARVCWPEASLEDRQEAAEFSRQVTEWILRARADFLTRAVLMPMVGIGESDAGNQKTLAAWDEYFSAFATIANASSYLRYLEVLFVNRPANLEERFAAVCELIDLRWPADVVAKTEAQGRAAVYCGLGRLLLGQGHVEAALEQLAKVAENTALSDAARELELVAKSFSMSQMYQEMSANRQSIVLQDDSMLVWEDKSGSDKVVFVFAGGGTNAFLMIASIHKYLKRMGCHAVYLLDRHSGFFLKAELWPTLSALRDELREIAGQLGAQKVYTLGNSSGGYAALRLGADLGAERILATSPLTTPATTAWPSTRSFFKSVCDEEPDFISNVADYFEHLGTCPPATVAFGEGADRDRASAETLRSFEQIRLFPVAGCNQHGSIRWLMSKGDFEPLLEELLADPVAD